MRSQSTVDYFRVFRVYREYHSFIGSLVASSILHQLISFCFQVCFPPDTVFGAPEFDVSFLIWSLSMFSYLNASRSCLLPATSSSSRHASPISSSPIHSFNYCLLNTLCGSLLVESRYKDPGTIRHLYPISRHGVYVRRAHRERREAARLAK